jgi:hypothetical protein
MNTQDMIIEAEEAAKDPKKTAKEEMAGINILARVEFYPVLLWLLWVLYSWHGN